MSYVWIPTKTFRWYQRVPPKNPVAIDGHGPDRGLTFYLLEGYGPPVLQQQWVNRCNGTSEWREIELVQEEIE